MNKLTSREIAKIAGVSVSTVSIVLNDRPGVGDETRRQITRILLENGITPRNLNKTTKGNVLLCKIIKHGRVLNENHNGFISEYLDGIVEASKKDNLSIEFVSFVGISIEKIANDLKLKKAIGLVILSTELDLEDIKILNNLPINTIFFDTVYTSYSANFVTMDNHSMVCKAINYLYENGHRKIGMLTTKGCENITIRERAFTEELIKLGIFKKSLIWSVNSSISGSYSDIEDILNTNPELPTAFFVCNDATATGAIKALQDHNISIPEEISIIGFDDIPSSVLTRPKLTTLSVPKKEIGIETIRLLNQCLNTLNPNNPKRKILLDGCLIKRESVTKI